MEPSIINSVAGVGGKVDIFTLLMLQVFQLSTQLYQMYLDSKKASQHTQIKDYENQIENLKISIQEIKTESAKNELKYEVRISSLEKEVYELRQENAELKGLLSAQADKENLINKYISSQTHTTIDTKSESSPIN